MRWRNLWLALGVFVGLVAWVMTLWITHVNHGEHPIVTIVFDESQPFKFDRNTLSFDGLQRARHRFPEVAMTGPGRLIFMVTPTMRSFSVSGIDPSHVTCGIVERERWAAVLVTGVEENGLTPIPVGASNGGALVTVPADMHAALVANPGSRGAIACEMHRPLASSPTFTERETTVHAETGPGGAVLVDVSGLEDIDNLRFSGGAQTPFGGDRSRLLWSGNDIVSAEWVDVTAQEQRDIVLVLIGALSAVSAAMIIEGIRPFVERKTGSREG